MILTEKLMQFQALSIITNGTSNRKRICRIHGGILSLIILGLEDVILDHFEIKFKLFNLICYAFLLLLRCGELIQFVEPFLELYLLHFVFIALGLSGLHNFKCVVDHVFEFKHKDILTVLNNVGVESRLGFSITSQQNSD